MTARMSTDHPGWMTTAQIAAKLGMSTDFVVGEIRDRRLDARVIVREGKRTVYRISAAQFDRYCYRFWGHAADVK